MKHILGALALAALALTAHAGDVQVELGQCRFGQAANGTYYDKDYNHRNYLTPRCASIGYAAQFKEAPEWGYRFAFITSGSIEARNNVALSNDGRPITNPCSAAHPDACRINVNGSGRMDGISVSLTRTTYLGHGFRVTGEFGALFFEHFFKGNCDQMDLPAQHQQGGGWDQVSKMGFSPSPMVGVTLGNGPVYVAARYYAPAVHRPGLSLTDHSFLQLSVGVVVLKF